MHAVLIDQRKGGNDAVHTYYVHTIYIHGITPYTVKQPAPLALCKGWGPLSYTYPFCVVLCLLLIPLCVVISTRKLRYSPYSVRSHDCVSYDVYNTYLYPCTYLPLYSD